MSYFVIKILNGLAHVEERSDSVTPVKLDYDFITGDFTPVNSFLSECLIVGDTLGTTTTAAVTGNVVTVASTAGFTVGEFLMLEATSPAGQRWCVITDITGFDITLGQTPGAAGIGAQVVASSHCVGQTDFTIEQDYKYPKYQAILGNTTHLRTTIIQYNGYFFQPTDNLLGDIASFLATGRDATEFYISSDKGLAYQFISNEDLLNFNYLLSGYFSNLILGQDSLLNTLWQIVNDQATVDLLVDSRTDALPTLTAPVISQNDPFGGFGKIQNYIKYSEEIDNVVWLKTGGVPPVVNANTGLAPNGTLTADNVTISGLTSELQQVLPISLSTTYHLSFWMKKTAGDGPIPLGIRIGTDGPVVSIIPTDYLKKYSFDISTGTSGLNLRIYSVSTISVDIWGIQLADCDACVSYVKTTDSIIDNGEYGLNVENVGYIDNRKIVTEGNRPEVRNYAFSQYATENINYMGGYYMYATTSATLTIGGTVTQTFGQANGAYGAHAFIVASGPGGTDLVLTVSGTSITDDGVRTTSDSEIIVVDTDQAIVNQYFETNKKWLGIVTFTLTGAAGSFTFNYGFSSYEDFENMDFTVMEFKFEAKAAASESNTDVILRHHSSSGWTYAAVGFQPTPTAICSMATDYSVDTEIYASEYFKYKRIDLNYFVNGAGNEGILIEFVQSGNNAVLYGTASVKALV
jgi:hypothetical protein